MSKEIKVFICFAAEDRYSIAEPIVYHLKNYGIHMWYDRQALLMGDNRKEKNLNEGANGCQYTIAIISKNTINSPCTMEELSIIKRRSLLNDVVVFPILYELLPEDIPFELQWIKELIFKETDRHSGTRDICNHIACKITGDFLKEKKYKTINDIIITKIQELPVATHEILYRYQMIDTENLNSRISLLYATYLIISNCGRLKENNILHLVSKTFDRLFSETRLNLDIDYRELWLLENSICLLVNGYLSSCTESNISTIIFESNSGR